MTRSLLGYGAIAGPFYLMSSLIEGVVHRDDGFRFTRDDWSLLAAGSHGWIHQTVFIVSGLMVVAAAVGVARAVSSRWAGPLIAVYGVGLVLAGLLVADGNGDYPIGSSDSGDFSGHGIGHLVAAMIGFFAVIAATFILASGQSSAGRASAALASRATGTIFLLGFVGVASGSSSSAVVLGFTFAVVVLWSWLAALSIQLFRDVLLRDRIPGHRDVLYPQAHPSELA